MICLNTRLLFYLLLRKYRPAIVLDVGSLDGSHAVRFRKLVPNAQIVAFEANPQNVTTLCQNSAFLQAGIELVPKAVCSNDGTLTFFIEMTSSTEPWRGGISSTRSRNEGSLGATPVQVDAIRLDTFIAARRDLQATTAVWIDAEGAAYEVLSGMQAVRSQVLFLHVEVETRQFWAGQLLKEDVETLMARFGFTCVARGLLEEQHDLVYLRNDVFATQPWRLQILLAVTWVLTRLQRLIGESIFHSIGNLYLKHAQKSSS